MARELKEGYTIYQDEMRRYLLGMQENRDRDNQIVLLEEWNACLRADVERLSRDNALLQDAMTGKVCPRNSLNFVHRRLLTILSHFPLS